MIVDDPYQEPTPEQIEKMREWYDRIVVPRLGTEFFFVSGGRMSMTPDKVNLRETFIRDGYGQGFTAMTHTVDKYWDWKVIVGWLFYTLVLGLAYIYIPSTRYTLYAYAIGASGAFIFRPFTKRWKYVKVSEEYKPFVSPHSEVPYKAQYHDEPHREKPSGQ